MFGNNLFVPNQMSFYYLVSLVLQSTEDDVSEVCEWVDLFLFFLLKVEIELEEESLEDLVFEFLTALLIQKKSILRFDKCYLISQMFEFQIVFSSYFIYGK